MFIPIDILAEWKTGITLLVSFINSNSSVVKPVVQITSGSLLILQKGIKSFKESGLEKSNITSAGILHIFID
ncbi:hypothetical protein D3C76_1862840 [compost metagenome]